METQYIEMVCTGNNGRSPVAELIAQNYLEKIGAKNYKARSSGTMVDAFLKNKVPIESKIKMIGFAEKNNLLTTSEKELLEDAIKTQNEKLLNSVYKVLLRKRL